MAQVVTRLLLSAEAVFNHGPSHVVFVVEKVAIEQVFLRTLSSFPVIIIPQVLHTHLHL